MIKGIYFLISLFVFSFQLEAQIQSKTSNNLPKKPQIDILKLVQDKAAQNISYIITDNIQAEPAEFTICTYAKL